MTQRPDLAAVALPVVGVLDLLRFHLFTIGAAWTSDYGDPEDPEQFAERWPTRRCTTSAPGTRYPATLVLTGDHDDRVVPLHSHKFTAALQHAQAGEAPILTRIEVATGHGMGSRPPWSRRRVGRPAGLRRPPHRLRPEEIPYPHPLSMQSRFCRLSPFTEVASRVRRKSVRRLRIGCRTAVGSKP